VSSCKVIEPSLQTITTGYAAALCSGCGVCVGVCPNSCIRMAVNEYGEYRVYREKANVCQDCGICLSVCPLYNHAEDEDTIGEKLFQSVPQIKHLQETGYYLNSFVGYSTQNSHRENGASGGMATWTLESLLKERLVDRVICVGPTDVEGQLYNFRICNTVEDIRSCSKSCYYPVEVSIIIKYILANEGKYAIMALPCVCKAIRLAQKKVPKLRDRITFVLGLVCGQTKSKFFAEYICAMGGGDPNKLKHVDFRVKDKNRPASDFGIKSVCENGVENTVFWTNGVKRVWVDRYFTPNACNFCDDVFAECADVGFMDAWLPNYYPDYRGHSIALIRDSQILNLFANAEKKEKMFLDRLDISDVIASQRDVLISKRVDIGQRLQLLCLTEEQIIPKRTTLFTASIPYIRRLWIKATLHISIVSSRKWIEYNKDITKFDKAMRYLRWYATIAYCLAKLSGKIRKVSRCFLRAILKWRTK